MDGIFTEYKWENGKNQDHVAVTNQLLFGIDPVAIDYLGWQQIARLREQYGLKPIEPMPAFIHKAAVDYRLGFDDRKKIELIDLDKHST